MVRETKQLCGGGLRTGNYCGTVLLKQLLGAGCVAKRAA